MEEGDYEKKAIGNQEGLNFKLQVRLSNLLHRSDTVLLQFLEQGGFGDT